MNVDAGSPELSAIACLCFLLVAPFALAGLACINAGFSRTAAVAHALFAPLLGAAIAAFCFFAIGFAWESIPHRAGIAVHVLGRAWDFIGTGPFFLAGVKLEGSPTALSALFGFISISLCAVIPIFGGAERWRLGPVLVSAATMGAIVFPLFAHWVWGGGWLSDLGATFMDAAGSGCIHATGGLTALCVAWILGPRRNKYNSSGMPAAMPGHNAPLVLLGCFIAFQGWLGLNAAGALLNAHTSASNTARVALNTLLAAVGGVIASAFVTKIRFRKPDASLCANGWVGGLVASSASCAVLKPAEAMLVGLISGTLVVFSVEIFELHLKVDDPGGAVSVHGIGGIWGVLAAGLFVGADQLAAQLVGIAALLGFVFPLSFGLNALWNFFLPYRIPREGERQGADLSELGAGAYPEFMVHRDDSGIR